MESLDALREAGTGRSSRRQAETHREDLTRAKRQSRRSRAGSRCRPGRKLLRGQPGARGAIYQRHRRRHPARDHRALQRRPRTGAAGCARLRQWLRARDFPGGRKSSRRPVPGRFRAGSPVQGLDPVLQRQFRAAARMDVRRPRHGDQVDRRARRETDGRRETHAGFRPDQPARDFSSTI